MIGGGPALGVVGGFVGVHCASVYMFSLMCFSYYIKSK